MKKLISLTILLLPLTGCVTGRGWQGLIPGKDLDLLDATITLSTPWGTETIHAARISTRVDPGANILPPLPLPGTNTPVVVTGPATVTPTK